MKKWVCIAFGSLLFSPIINAADESASQQIQALNKQIQTQLAKIQADSQQALVAANKNIQAQIQQTQAALSAQIKSVSDQLGDQIKKGDAALQKQIGQVQQNALSQIKELQQKVMKQQTAPTNKTPVASVPAPGAPAGSPAPGL